MYINRRNFLKNSTLAAGLPLVGCAQQVSNTEAISLPKINKGDTILFQGDSITDSFREKEKELANNTDSMGKGYAFLAASKLLKTYPRMALTIYNRGISGNKVNQLSDRWEKDALDLKPDWISILIGVNDYWHMLHHGYKGTFETYENGYRKLLKRTKEALPDVKLIICQPFAVPGTTAVDESWVEPFGKYQASAKKLALEFNAFWVPFQEVFDKAILDAPASYWIPDGVHPSISGSQLMADTWLKIIEST
jgi:lysophospholipase L1-like esterase